MWISGFNVDLNTFQVVLDTVVTSNPVVVYDF
nr:MAG TPA: hypothetical protein [Caudoviricetes sp.]